ncbi:MAG: hypothetical protein AAFX44_06665 [Pseudomonadota bacterium]
MADAERYLRPKLRVEKGSADSLGDYHVRELSGAAAYEFAGIFGGSEASLTPENISRLIFHAFCNEDGTRAFTKEQSVAFLDAHSAATVSALVEHILRVSGLSDEGQEDIAKE